VDVDLAHLDVAARDAVPVPVEQAVLDTRSGAPRDAQVHEDDEARRRRLEVGEHLLLHARGVRMGLDQLVGEDVGRGGAPPRVEVDLRLGAEHGDAVPGRAVLADPARDLDRLGERVRPVQRAARRARVHAQQEVAVDPERGQDGEPDERDPRGGQGPRAAERGEPGEGARGQAREQRRGREQEQEVLRPEALPGRERGGGARQPAEPEPRGGPQARRAEPRRGARRREDPERRRPAERAGHLPARRLEEHGGRRGRRVGQRVDHRPEPEAREAPREPERESRGDDGEAGGGRACERGACGGLAAPARAAPRDGDAARDERGRGLLHQEGQAEQAAGSRAASGPRRAREQQEGGDHRQDREVLRVGDEAEDAGAEAQRRKGHRGGRSRRRVGQAASEPVEERRARRVHEREPEPDRRGALPERRQEGGVGEEDPRHAHLVGLGVGRDAREQQLRRVRVVALVALERKLEQAQAQRGRRRDRRGDEQGRGAAAQRAEGERSAGQSGRGKAAERPRSEPKASEGGPPQDPAAQRGERIHAAMEHRGSARDKAVDSRARWTPRRP
jgi:hypothetical protein